MMREYEVKHYAVYFREWCQAFGEHASLAADDSSINWLLAAQLVGFILPQHLMRSLYREALGKRGTPVLELDRSSARIGSFQCPLSASADTQDIAALKNVLEKDNDASLFLTSPFMYGTGSRIITLACRKPLSIIYKEIGPMRVRLD